MSSGISSFSSCFTSARYSGFTTHHNSMKDAPAFSSSLGATAMAVWRMNLSRTTEGEAWQEEISSASWLRTNSTSIRLWNYL